MATQWDQIKTEHCYPKIMSTWSSTDLSFPTHYLFDSSDDNAQHSTQTDEDEDATIDIMGVSDPPTISPRPFDHYKVASVMNECSQHMNLVRLSFDNHELEEERVFGECSFQQQTLLTKCYQILRQDLLLRMTYAGLHQWRSSDVQLHQEEMIKRRFQCDHSAKQFRKVFADIKWDPHLTQWCHRTLMKVLDNDLLPVYMDVLQLLKSKCPALVEQMIHSSSGEGVNEALKLLLKRPWNPAFGLPQIDKEIHFEPSPIFVTLPHSTGLLGSRRLRLWQIQLNSYGKVFPVMPYKTPSESSHKMTLRESMECIIQSTLCRVQELKEQYPSRPILLVSWSTACRVACKVAEVEKVSCLINLGLTVRGLKGSWDITNDPFLQCTTPCIFIVGCDGLCSSVEYTQELRSRMKSTTSLVLINGADDYLRLAADKKNKELITQSMADRIIQDKIFEFMVYVLPCSFPVDAKVPRKRKAGSTDEQCYTYLSNATNSPIILRAQSPDDYSNVNTSSSVLRSLLTVKPSSSTPSPAPVPNKIPRIGRPPKLGRPRSKSMTCSDTKPGKTSKSVLRNRSKSGDVHQVLSPATTSSPVKTGNSSTNASPDTLLSLTKRSLCPILPITPPKTSQNMIDSTETSHDTNMNN